MAAKFRQHAEGRVLYAPGAQLPTSRFLVRQSAVGGNRPKGGSRKAPNRLYGDQAREVGTTGGDESRSCVKEGVARGPSSREFLHRTKTVQVYSAAKLKRMQEGKTGIDDQELRDLRRVCPRGSGGLGDIKPDRQDIRAPVRGLSGED